jgi:hypothetical protein
MIRPDLGKTGAYLPVSRQNISHLGGEKARGFRGLIRFDMPPENPRVGGSIPPLATNKMKAITVRSTSYAMEYSREHGIFLGSLRFASSPARWPAPCPAWMTLT